MAPASRLTAIIRPRPATPVVGAWGYVRRSATFDWDIFSDGLLVTGMGMGVVFAVLATLMIAITLVGRADRSAARRAEKRASRAESEDSAGTPESESERSEPTPEVIAAISVALALAQDEQRPEPVEGALEGAIAGPRAAAGGPSPWVLAGRRRALEGSPRSRQ